MKLYEVSWSIYPRRVGIYLTEKGIDGIERVEVSPPADASKHIIEGVTHAGTVPALDIGDGQIIGASVAIMEYLEECFPTPDLIGANAAERAATREFNSVVEEAAIHFRAWVYNACLLFEAHGTQSKEVAKAGMNAFFEKLRLLERMAADRKGEFLLGDSPRITDCIAYSLLQTSVEMFDAPIPDDCPFLKAWYKRFAERPSGAVPDYPPVLEVTRGLVAQTHAT